MVKIPCAVTRHYLNIEYHPEHLELNINDGDPIYLSWQTAGQLRRIMRHFRRIAKANWRT